MPVTFDEMPPENSGDTRELNDVSGFRASSVQRCFERCQPASDGRRRSRRNQVARSKRARADDVRSVAGAVGSVAGPLALPLTYGR